MTKLPLILLLTLGAMTYGQSLNPNSSEPVESAEMIPVRNPFLSTPSS